MNTRRFGLAAALVCVALSASCSVEGWASGEEDEDAGRPSAPRAAVAMTPGGTVAQTPPIVLEKATNPEEAFRFRRLSWLNENGRLEPGSLQRALDQRRTNVDFWASPFSTRGAGITPLSWVSRGPSNIGGRTLSLVIHPTQTNRMWAGAVDGGIWYSSDSGATWNPVDDGLPNLAIGALAIAPSNPNIMYAGTGEGFFNGDAVGGIGMYRSTDGGVTWTYLPSTAGFGNVCSIAVNPTNAAYLLVGTRYYGIQKSVNSGGTWSNPYWAQGCYYVAFDPTNSTRAIAELIDYNFGTNEWFHRALYSTNTGTNWTAATGLDYVVGWGSRIALAYAKSNPSIVYATCAADSKIYKSTDGGHSYAPVTTGGSTDTSWYCAPLWVDPTNPNVLMAGGYHTKRSTDGGVTLTQVSNGYINTTDPHPDIHTIISDPGFNGTTNKRVYICTDGSVYRTDDIYSAAMGVGWTRLDQTYRTTQFYGAAGHGPSGTIYGGTQDNGSLLLKPGSDVATLPFGGDGGFCAVDYVNPKYLYGEYITLQIHRSTNGGASAGYIVNGLADAGTAANFIAPFVLDPNVNSRMLAGGASLWRNNGVNNFGNPPWTAIRAPGSDYISNIAIAQGNSDIVWISQNDGKIYKSTNATAAAPAWTAVDDNAGTNPLPNRWVGRIVIDPDDSSTVYVGLGGFSPDNLWRTTDGGATWANISGVAPAALPSAPVRGIARHPSRPDWLYVGTEVGIFTSSDDGNTWSASNDGPNSACVDELVFMYGSTTLLAATHGRGLFTAPVVACPSDFNGDGFVDPLDYNQFINAFESGDRTADFNRDGFIDPLDYNGFINAFETGC